MKASKFLPLLLVAACVPAVAQSPAAPQLRLFHTQARVSVDASGAITGIEAPTEFGKAVGDAVEAQVRKLQFTAPTIDGKAVPGETWVQMQACTAPDGDGYRLAMKFRGNGPTLANTVHPVYPFVAQRAQIGATYKIAVDIAPDGSARLSSATAVAGAKRFDREFQQSLATWVKAMRYRVESVDGKPIGGQVTQTVEFVTGESFSGGSMAQARKRMEARGAADQQARALASDACALALKAADGDATRQVAVHSAVKVSEAN